MIFSDISRRTWVIFGVAVIIMGMGIWYLMRISVAYPPGSLAWIRIPPRATPEQVTDSLVQALGPEMGKVTASMVNLRDTALAGAYRVEGGESAWHIARRINAHRQSPIKLTLNNIRTPRQLAERISTRLYCPPDSFLKALREVAAEEGTSPDSLMCQLLPNTYEVYWMTSPRTVIAKIRAFTHQFWDPVRLAKAEALGLTPGEVTILASIVEEESNKADERGAIARVYLNRLSRGMRLQADPTVKYALGDFSIKRLSHEMTQVQSPYNTYEVYGLPPGPIRMPEPSSISAVLNAPEHPYIYMCAKADMSGYHAFAANFADHRANAMRYHAALNRLNIHHDSTPKE